MTIKTTIALEFGNRKHRDEFLKGFQALLHTFGNKSPKVTLTLTQKTEAEFGDPSSLDLFWCGVDMPAPPTPMDALIEASSVEAQLAAVEAEDVTTIAAVRVMTPEGPGAMMGQPYAGTVDVMLDAGVACSFPEAEVAAIELEPAAEGATYTEPPTPPSVAELILYKLAAHGPATITTLAGLLERTEDEITGAMAELHIANDVEPDDGETWRINSAAE